MQDFAPATAGWLLMLLCVMYSLAVTGGAVTGQVVGYDLLVLLPLTGSEAPRGRAQLAGVRAALRSETGLNLTEHGTEQTLDGDAEGGISIRLFLVDTQCDRTKEDAAIIRHLVKTRRIIILGGLCHHWQLLSDITSLQHSFYIRETIPQIVFDRSLQVDHNQPQTLLSVRPSRFSAYSLVIAWLRSIKCHYVAVLDALSISPYREKEKRFLWEELRNNKIVISLQMEVTNVKLVELLEKSQVRIVIVQAATQSSMKTLCHLVNKTRNSPNRYIWVLLLEDALPQIKGHGPCSWDLSYNAMIFNVQTTPPTSQMYDAFVQEMQAVKPEIEHSMIPDAAFAHDAATLAIRTMSTFRKVVATMSDSLFSDRFMREVRRGANDLPSGNLMFDHYGRRDYRTEQYLLTENGLAAVNFTGGTAFDHSGSQVPRRVSLDGVPVAAFIIMAALSTFGIIYSLLIMAFNVLKRNDKMIKMTSTNINLIITFGAIMGYISMITLGFDSSRVSYGIMAKLVQASVFLLSMGYSLVFGSLFAKAWRVFYIFRNLNSNGKNTRDEHLLVGVLVLLLVDILVLVPWITVDPIKCSAMYTAQEYTPSPPTDVVYQSDVCTSQLQTLWVLILYGLKSSVLIAGLYFTFQTRHVTLPTLRDAREIYDVIFLVATFGLLCLPLLMVPRVSLTVKYSVGALAIFTVLTATLTFSFIPKIYFLWRRRDKNAQDSIRFLFTESLRKTQRNLTSCSGCFCFSDSNEDRYAQEMLGSEIATLKRTIKEKDTTIRELTDRLYFGTEKKLHEYISSPRHQALCQDVSHHQICPTQANNMRSNSPYYTGDSLSVPEQHVHQLHQLCPDGTDSHDSSQESAQGVHGAYSERSRRAQLRRQQQRSIKADLRGSSRLSPNALLGLSVSKLQEGTQEVDVSRVYEHTPQRDSRYHSVVSSNSTHVKSPSCLNYSDNNDQTVLTMVASKYNSPSPNHDSAIDNNSPSSVGSDQDSLSPERVMRPEDAVNLGGHWGHRGGLDLAAIEQEAISVEARQTERCGHPKYCLENGIAHTTIYEDGVAVSQI